MADYVDIVRSVRRRVGDKPDQSRITIAVDADDDELTLPSGHVSVKFPKAGGYIEFDDGSGEQALIDTMDAGANTLSILRGHNGTQATSHEINCTILLPPRYDFVDYVERIDAVIDAELWPHVWIAMETTLAAQTTNEYYSPTVADIEDVSYAYQIVSGEKRRLHVEWLDPAVADDLNFPRGAVIIRETWDTSTIFVAYKALPTISNLTPALVATVKLGVTATLLMEEESQLLSPDARQLDRRVSEGSNVRAGSLLWQRFIQQRDNVRLQLLDDEQAGTIYVRGR